jgi:hypothetical protein
VPAGLNDRAHERVPLSCGFGRDDARRFAMHRPYQEEHAKGSRVKIAPRSVLEQFVRDWKYHNKLQPEQLNYADQCAEVESVGFYHGGDELYKLKGVPGAWHSQCLLPARNGGVE